MSKQSYPILQETKDALLAMRNRELDIEYVCEICGDELDEYEQCFTCSGVHND